MSNLTLQQWSVLLGSVAVGGAVVSLVWPDKIRAFASGFSRNVAWGWILTAIDLLWVAYVILHAPLGRFEFLKPAVYVAAPISFGLIVYSMGELLAARAAGGFLLLVANPILNAARWHPSPWRLVVVVLTYLWVIAGMVFVLSPYRLRDLLNWAVGNPARLRVLAVIRFLVGGLLIYLGFRAF